MKILILTSKDHLYSNFILQQLIIKGCFSRDQVTVWEQDSIVPGKSKLQGLLKYLRTSGFIYIFWQILKIFIFSIKRFLASIENERSSGYYPFEKLAPSWKIKIINDIKRIEIIDEVIKMKPYLLISLMSKEIIPESILSIPKYGAVNLHPAPLPKFRGVSPTFWALSTGSLKFGVTLHVLDKNIDTGGIIGQRLFNINGIKSEHKLYMECGRQGVLCLEIFLNTLHKKPAKAKGKPYNGSSSYFSLPTKQAVNNFMSNGCVFFYWKELF